MLEKCIKMQVYVVEFNYIWEVLMNREQEFIRDMSNANGLSGFEDEVLEVIRNYVGNSFDVKEDKMRNLYLYSKKHNNDLPTIMLDGHSDEVGFMVQSINKNGLIKFMAIGGWFSQNVGAHKVRVRNSDGDYITGIVASKPPHFMTNDERNKITQISEMLIDVGATSIDEVVNDFKIEPGAPIVPDVDFEYNGKMDIMIGKAFDNRLGCALVVEVMKELESYDLEVNVVGAISSQEEIGTRGSVITSNVIKPDIAIIFEGTPADDSHRNEYERQGAVKCGPQIRHRDTSMIANPRFIKFARDIAKENNIKFQDAVRLGGGTDAGKIHLSNEGVPCFVIGVPVRYAHTHYGISSYSDFLSAKDWAKLIVSSLNTEEIDKL